MPRLSSQDSQGWVPRRARIISLLTEAIIFDRFKEPSQHHHEETASRTVFPATKRLPFATDAPHRERNVKFIDTQDPQIFNRNIAYHYDRRDLDMPRTVISPDGRTQSRTALNYSRTPPPPGEILCYLASPGSSITETRFLSWSCSPMHTHTNMTMCTADFGAAVSLRLIKALSGSLHPDHAAARPGSHAPATSCRLIRASRKAPGTHAAV